MTRENDLLDEWLAKATDENVHKELEALKEAGDQDAIVDAFYQDLAFGTAGLRGVVGAGTNRMNIYTVGRATQGFSNYLNEHFENPSVAIARDSRRMGEQFTRTAAAVFAANGVKAYVYPRIEPTPALSFAVRDLKCAGGVCVTASHNPAEYNGYKAYGPDGCQIATKVSQDISDAIEAVDTFADVKTCDFEKALADGKIAWIGEDTLDRFIDAIEAQSLPPAGGEEVPLKVVYTPLNGTGIECISRILERVGVTDVVVVPEQADPDENFTTCPYPNPENRDALEKGIELCERVHPDLLLASDPDADRVGIAVEDNGEYVLLSGNEVGVLLLDFVARKHAERGEDMKRKVAVTTIVSSMMVDAVAQTYGFSVRRVLTGFKYIGNVITQLEEAGEEDRFLFGFEESYGYLCGPHVRDKDAVVASMLICQMAQDCKQRGTNLAEHMKQLYERYGYYRNKTVSLTYPGASGAARMAEIMSGLRASHPAELGGFAVEGVVDYKDGVNGLPLANVVEFDLAGDNRVIVRPSGTEPKIKLYLFGKAADAASADAIIAALEKAGRGLLE